MCISMVSASHHYDTGKESIDAFIASIAEKDLRDNIYFLRDAAEKIWTPSIRLLQGYTDHDIKHSERVANNAINLLGMNNNINLLDQEKYLLLSAIFLHDIGMQCDIARYPEIHFKAEQLGAKFNTEFKASNIAEYSNKEKRAIRENHQYLSAAWISYAFKSHKTELGDAASRIPAYLVSDLIEICKYHSKLPINNCIIASINYPTIRVQFLAALLRFADELDTDRNRIPFSVIKLFKLDPYNAVYWWLHNLTIITYEPANVIILKIMLNEEDYAKFNSAVYDNFIMEFQTKNHPVITILRQNGIPVAIGAESCVVKDSNAESLPEDIKAELTKLTKSFDQLESLAHEVRTWLRALSYEIYEMIPIDRETIEMEASADHGISNQKVLVVCLNRDLKIYDIDNIFSRIDMDMPSGLLITNKRISLKVSDYAYTKKNIHIFYINDFLQQRIWGSYFTWLKSQIDMESIQQLYIDLGCYQEDITKDPVITEKHSSLDNFIDKWLREPGKTHISLLGDFGTGKTWFCRHYAYRQLNNYLNDPIKERLPLLITLREFSKATTAKQLINDALIEQYKLPFKGSAFDIFKDLNRRGKLLLILDGFDEMARKVDYQTVVDNFWELANLTDNNSKVILTSRTEYFRQSIESEKILGGETFGRNTLELSPPKFETLYVDKLSDNQIRNLILKRRGITKGNYDVDLILSIKDLSEMARKPVLIELLLSALDEVGTKKENIPKNISQVYLYATNNLILRNIKSERTFSSTTTKLYFLCELSWQMIKNNNLRIHFSAFPDIIIKYFGEKIKGEGELDNWDYDVRNNSLFHRDSKGYYEFAHKSLAEFFVAFKFAAEMGCISKKFEQTYLENDLKPAIVPYKPKSVLDLAKTFGALSLLDPALATIREFLMNMTADDAPGTLWRILDESSDKPQNEAKFCGGNASIMLQDLGIWRPSPYRDITNLLEQMLMPQEYVFPPSPAKMDQLEKNLLVLGYDISTNKFKKGQSDNPLNFALKAYNLIKEGKLEESCSIIEITRTNYPKLRDFYLSLVSYAGIQSLYIGKLNESERYFSEYEKVGGNRNWSGLKINEVRLHSISHRGITLRDSKLIQGVRHSIEKIKQDSINIGDTLNEAKSFLFLGIIDRLETRYEESINNLRKARELFIRERNISRIGVSSANIAFTYRLMGNYDDAISNYNIAIKNFEEGKDAYRIACARARRGGAFRALKHFDKAIEDYEAALAIIRDQDDFQKAVVLKELGTTYLRMGRWNEAIENYNEALTYFSNINNIHIEGLNSRKGQTFYSLGLAYLMQAKWAESLEHFKNALSIFEERFDNYNISLAQSSIGIALKMLNLDKDALFHFNKALDVVTNEMKDKKRECMIITQISEVHLKMHSYNQALNKYSQALGIAERLNDDRMRGNIIGQIGITYRLMNILTKAEPNFKLALQIFMGLSDKAKVSWMLEELGQVYIKQGFYDKAIHEYNAALKHLGASDKALIDENLVNLVEGFVLEAIHKGKIQKYKAALNEIEKLGALSLRCKILRNLGEAYRRSGKYNESIKLLNESLEIARVIDDKTQKGKILSYLGLTYADFAQSSEGADAIAFKTSSTLRLSESLKVFQEMGDKFLEGWVLENQAEVYLKQRSWDMALENYKKAIELESEENSGFIHLGLATCYKNLSNFDLYKNECKLAHKLLSIEGMNEYSLACLEAICGKLEKSIDLLEIALNKGQANIEHISQDPYLRDLQNIPDYRKLQNRAYGDMQMIPFM